MTSARSPRLPGSTYRVQFTADFTFRHALEYVDYWYALGIDDLYASPFFVARPGSPHGYDVVDPREINPEIGTEDDLGRLHEKLASRGMGLVMDLVPNHMCVGTSENEWWNDVLEKGPSSPYAKFFDIDWRPPKPELSGKLLLPVLENPFGRVLEDADLEVKEARGALRVHYRERSFPVAPGTAPVAVERALRRLRDAPPTDPGAVSAARRSLDAELCALNGSKGTPRSFDALEDMLARQAYRLSHWRVAADHINYRRFFDVNDLAAVRVEEPEVLDAVHGKAFDLVERGWVTGLRIDHIDGLREPRQYLKDIERRTGGCYVVIEKILGEREETPESWATEGTTGYEFLRALDGLFISHAGEAPLQALYSELRTGAGTFEDVAYEARRSILDGPMSSELSVMTRRLDRISEQHRGSRDFTVGLLRHVLASTIACFPVYRTYVAAKDTEVSSQDAATVGAALSAARGRSPSVDPSAFDFLGDVLLLRDPEGSSETQRAERREFILRFQQLSGPVMAKGVEDTAFYRYIPLLCLNEVGGGPAPFGIPVSEFHGRMADRARRCPGSLSATSTHDTKRAEDGRSRLGVISERPAEWATAVHRWREIAAPLKARVDGRPAPDADDEYYIYQTILGAWPVRGIVDSELPALTLRVQEAVAKAVREAKRNSSWVNQNGAYEEALRSFVSRLLEPEGLFAPEMGVFASRVVTGGLLTSLAKLAIKITAPGVPDFFQGTELWDFSMVDPDNRRRVDLARRALLLEDLRRRSESDRPALVRELLETIEDGRLKLFVTSALLACRRKERDLFAYGAYVPLAVEGPRSEHVVAFARRGRKRMALTVTGRFFAQLGGDPAPSGRGLPSGREWGDTVVRLPQEATRAELTDVLSGARLRHDGRFLRVSDVFDSMPFALLVGDVLESS